jgi:molybdopterin/thiamine biosynthesis adenylyltransferase
MNAAQRERYSRQILFPPIGEAGQERLLAAHAVIAGCGALGSFHAGALARAGVGRLTIIDRDYVEPSNLHRQFLFEEADADAALPKAAAAAQRLARINSSVEVRAAVADLTPANMDDLLAGADIILDGTDNFQTRYLINDFAVSRGIPWIYGAAVAAYGLTMPVIPGHTACLRCVYPEPTTGVQPTCETAGVLSATVSAIASLQVADTLRILATGQVHARITTVDVWGGVVRQVEGPDRDPECPCCGRREFPHLEDRGRAPVSLCGRNAVQVEGTGVLDLSALAGRLRQLGEVRVNQYALRAQFGGYDVTVFGDGRAIIKGTDDTALARSLYARYIG